MLSAQAIVRRQRQPNAPAYLRNFVDDRDVFRIPQPGSAIFGIHEHPHEAHFAHGLKNMKRKGLCFIPLHDMGSNVLKGKITGRFADRIEFGLALGVDGVQNVNGIKGSRENR